MLVGTKLPKPPELVGLPPPASVVTPSPTSGTVTLNNREVVSYNKIYISKTYSHKPLEAEILYVAQSDASHPESDFMVLQAQSGLRIEGITPLWIRISFGTQLNWSGVVDCDGVYGI
jgi:hypothetical protein